MSRVGEDIDPHIMNQQPLTNPEIWLLTTYLLIFVDNNLQWPIAINDDRDYQEYKLLNHRFYF